LAIDLASRVFQLHGVDKRGNPLLRKKVSRAKLGEVVAKLPPCLIVMEACGSSNYWARRFQSMGHQVKLISANFVKPFVKGNKNDRNDAEAIFEASARPTMRFVPIKSIEQQDIQAVHRVRSLLMKDRNATINQIRGLLAEEGVRSFV
jgi:transposase